MPWRRRHARTEAISRRLRWSALLVLVFVLGPVSSAAADTVVGGNARLQLGPDFSTTLRQAGVQAGAGGPARLRGRSLTLPVLDGELTAGSGQVRLGGAIYLRAAGRKLTLGALVLDTGNGSLIAELSGKRFTLAIARRPRLRRHNFGFEITLGKLVLTGAGAARLDRALGLGRVLASEDVLGTMIGGVRFGAVTVTHGTAYLGFNEAFWAKLHSLGVAGESLGGGWPYSRSPFVAALSKLRGSLALDLTSGELESADGLRLFQGKVVGDDVYPVAGAPEVTLQGIAVDLAGLTLSAELRAQPPGVGGKTMLGGLQIPVFHKNAYTGDISIPNSPLTLSPNLAEALNRTFAEPQGRPGYFVAGEPFGSFAFSAGTHGGLS